MLLYILILHQTTTPCGFFNPIVWLLYILILHQTTTLTKLFYSPCRLLYILILHQTTTHLKKRSKLLGCFISWFYIKPQHVWNNYLENCRCFISWFYIKPQPNCITTLTKDKLLYILILHQTTTRPNWWWQAQGCFISWFYIKPQLSALTNAQQMCCFISWFYIKPQLIRLINQTVKVALYLDSTSNHNNSVFNVPYASVALYLDSTSNHNDLPTAEAQKTLLYILILHQTTTAYGILSKANLLLYILILHQTTTGCYLIVVRLKVALYLDSTSNHNVIAQMLGLPAVALYLDSTSNHNTERLYMNALLLL